LGTLFGEDGLNLRSKIDGLCDGYIANGLAQQGE
jgi:hypothetical protein